MNARLTQLMQRARAYWFQDGLAELVIGSEFLIFGLFLIAQALVTARFPTAGSLFGLLFPFLMIGLALAGNWLVPRLKARYTYPRTGYVAYPRSGRTSTLPMSGQKWNWPVGLGALAAVALLVLLLSFRLDLLAWLPLLDGLLLAAILLFFARSLGELRRFYLLAAVALLTGLLLALARLDANLGQGVFFALNGLAVLLSGGVMTWRYFHP